MRTSVPVTTIEKFERRIEELEAAVGPQLLEIRALEAGLERLRREGERNVGWRRHEREAAAQSAEVRT